MLGLNPGNSKQAGPPINSAVPAMFLTEQSADYLMVLL